MGKRTVQASVKKTYSNTEVLQQYSKTLTILERDAKNGSAHAIAVLKEIFDTKEGSGPRTNETQTLTPNPHQQMQATNIDKSKGTSFTSY